MARHRIQQNQEIKIETIPRLAVCLAIALLFLACGSDPLNHLPGVDPWTDGNPTEFALASSELCEALAAQRSNWRMTLSKIWSIVNEAGR